MTNVQVLKRKTSNDDPTMMSLLVESASSLTLESFDASAIKSSLINELSIEESAAEEITTTSPCCCGSKSFS